MARAINFSPVQANLQGVNYDQVSSIFDKAMGSFQGVIDSQIEKQTQGALQELLAVRDDPQKLQELASTATQRYGYVDPTKLNQALQTQLGVAEQNVFKNEEIARQEEQTAYDRMFRGAQLNAQLANQEASRNIQEQQLGISRANQELNEKKFRSQEDQIAAQTERERLVQQAQATLLANRLGFGSNVEQQPSAQNVSRALSDNTSTVPEIGNQEVNNQIGFLQNSIQQLEQEKAEVASEVPFSEQRGILETQYNDVISGLRTELEAISSGQPVPQTGVSESVPVTESILEVPESQQGPVTQNFAEIVGQRLQNNQPLTQAEIKGFGEQGRRSFEILVNEQTRAELQRQFKGINLSQLSDGVKQYEEAKKATEKAVRDSLSPQLAYIDGWEKDQLDKYKTGKSKQEDASKEADKLNIKLENLGNQVGGFWSSGFSVMTKGERREYINDFRNGVDILKQTAPDGQPILSINQLNNLVDSFDPTSRDQRVIFNTLLTDLNRRKERTTDPDTVELLDRMLENIEKADGVLIFNANDFKSSLLSTTK